MRKCQSIISIISIYNGAGRRLDVPPPLLIIKLGQDRGKEKGQFVDSPAADNILLPAAEQASFSTFSLYIGNTAKTRKAEQKKRLPQTGKPGQPQTHPNTGAALTACMVIIPPAGKCCKIQERKMNHEQRRSKTGNPAQSEDNRLSGKEQRRLVLLPFLRERSWSAQDRRSQILSNNKYYLLFWGLRKEKL